MLFQKKGVVGALARTMSAQVAYSSHELLTALEGGNIDEVRSVLANTEKGLKRYRQKHTVIYRERHRLDQGHDG